MAKKSKEPEAEPDSGKSEIGINASAQLENRDLEEEAVATDELPEVFEDKARNDIYSKYEKHQQEASGEVAVEETKPAIETAAEPTPAPEEQPSPEPVPTPEPSPELGAVSTSKHKLTVNGQTLEYTTEELIQQAQLGIGARQKFDEAARLRQEAALERQRAQEIMFAGQQQAQNTQQKPSASPAQQLPDIPEAELKDIAKRINYGSEEEQAAAIRDAIMLGSKMGQPQFTPENIVNVATQNAINALTMQQENAIINSEFKDILSDIPLSMATEVTAMQLAQKYANLGTPKSRLDIMREAGNTVRDKYLKPIASPQTTVPSTPTVAIDNDKIERKRTAPKQPAAASKVSSDMSVNTSSSATPEQALDSMRREAFAEIVKSRGAQPY